MTKEEALAHAWASIDGKLDAFKREREQFADDTFDGDAPDYTGHYEGYVAEAEEMIRRMRALGYVVVAVDPDEAELRAIAVAFNSHFYDEDGTFFGAIKAARAAMIAFHSGKV
jgi:hypothetical protein